jgi:hypothetical protein
MRRLFAENWGYKLLSLGLAILLYLFVRGDLGDAARLPPPFVSVPASAAPPAPPGTSSFR